MLKPSAESLIYEQFYSIKIIILIRVDRAKMHWRVYVRKKCDSLPTPTRTILYIFFFKERERDWNKFKIKIRCINLSVFCSFFLFFCRQT